MQSGQMKEASESAYQAPSRLRPQRPQEAMSGAMPPMEARRQTKAQATARGSAPESRTARLERQRGRTDASSPPDARVRRTSSDMSEAASPPASEERMEGKVWAASKSLSCTSP
jgi:hypothetical protein